jgi:hypothetical protein
VLALGRSQYFAYALAGALITRVVGDALVANRILLSLVAVAWPYSLRALLRALGRDERLALFGAMVFYNRALGIGFLPYLASVPVALFALAALIRMPLIGGRRLAPAARLALWSVGLFYTHVSTYLLFLLTSVAVAGPLVALKVPEVRDRFRWLAVAGAALAPSVLLALLWWRAGSLVAEGEGVTRMPLGLAVHLWPVWTFDLWRSHADEVCAIAWWSAFGLIMSRGLRDREVGPAPWPAVIALAPFFACALLYLVTPFRVGAAGYLNLRLAPLVSLLAVVGLRPRHDAWGAVPLVVAAAADVAMSATAFREMQRTASEMLGDPEPLLAAVRPHARVALLNFEVRSARTQERPFIFFGSYLVPRAQAIAAYSFAELAHWPVHYAPQDRPPPHSAFWVYQPCDYRYRQDGAFYDYVLVQGRVRPFGSGVPGPTFSPIARAGVFTLYEKVGPPPGSDEPTDADVGPCQRRFRAGY